MVLVWAPSETMLQFPHMRLELASQIAYQMKQRLKTTEIVPPDQVAAYQDRNLNWDAVPPSRDRQAVRGRLRDLHRAAGVLHSRYQDAGPVSRAGPKASIVVHDVG